MMVTNESHSCFNLSIFTFRASIAAYSIRGMAIMAKIGSYIGIHM